MNNLTQNQSDAKQDSLYNQQAQMIAQYEKADGNERAAIILQIDSFLPIIKNEEKSFWLQFRQKLERIGVKSTK